LHVNEEENTKNVSHRATERIIADSHRSTQTLSPQRTPRPQRKEKGKGNREDTRTRKHEKESPWSRMAE
jgi:hypothetical protein